MSVSDIKDIIEEIPAIIKYIYPGYLTIYTYSFLRARTIKDTKAIIIKSIAISYIYVLLIQELLPSNVILENVVLIIMPLFISYIAYRLVRSDLINKVFRWLCIESTFYDNEIEALQDLKHGTWLCVYMKDPRIVYEGSLLHKDLEEGKRNFITLCKYRKYSVGEDDRPVLPYIENHDDNEEEAVTLNYSEIQRIEKRALD